jgi:hypothetical protein
MILDSTSKRVRVYLGGAVTTNELHWYASYADLDDDAPSFFGKSESGLTNGVTPVEVMTAPAGTVQRQAKYLEVFNTDTVQAEVWFESFDGTQRTLFRAELEPNERVIYVHEVGWTVYSPDGTVKTIASPLTTKGDIWGYDTADARIPVGADGEVLVADSTQTLGVDWRPVPRPVLVTTAVAFAASPYAVLDADDVILVDATLGNVEVDLPAAGSHAGRLLRVKKIDASINTVTIDPSGAELIDGAANLVLALQHEVAGFVSDGTEWWIV